MRKYVLIFFIMLSLSGFTQSLTDLFLLMPENRVKDLKPQDRKEMIKAYKNNLKDSLFGENKCQLEDFDSKNGYLKITGAFSGEIEMCFWHLDKEQILIATTRNSCGPVCAGSLYLFIFDKGVISEQPLWSYLPNRKEFEQINFVKDEVKVSDIRKLYTENFYMTFKLPRYGKNIRCIYEWREYFEDNYVRSVLKGDNLELVLENGQFKIGNIYFE